MTLPEISNLRLINQQIAASRFSSPGDIAGWMGAIQAQDFPMAKWAIGLRIPWATEDLIETAFDKGEIIRTHLLRPTWHIVSSEDIYWMLELTASRIKSSMKSRNRELELSDPLLRKTNSIIRKALTGGNHLTREEIYLELHKVGIKTDNNRSSHILMQAELDGIVCSGRTKNKKLTYALLEERATRGKKLTREEALVKLAGRYFRSHGPATIRDFAWWSGLTISEAGKAMGMIGSELIREKTTSEIYWFDNDLSSSVPGDNSLFLLPAYDEFMISYSDRSASLSKVNNRKVISVNGVFRPVIIIDGQVSGLWKRVVQRDQVTIDTYMFEPPRGKIKRLIERKIEEFASFNGKIPVWSNHDFAFPNLKG